MVGPESTIRKANSVPPSLAKALAETVLIQVFGRKISRDTNGTDQRISFHSEQGRETHRVLPFKSEIP